MQMVQGVLPLPTEDQRFELFGNYVESLRTQAGIPGLAAAVVGPDDIVWERAFGQQDVERSMATRTDTLFHLDGLTQLFTSVLVLRCVEEGSLSLDERVGEFVPNSPDANSTIRQILSHTSGPSGNQTFFYRPAALAPLGAAITRCDTSLRQGIAEDVFDRLAMVDSVPGPDIVSVVPPPDGIPAASIERYRGLLPRLATPYMVRAGQTLPSRTTVTSLTPTAGLISTVRDFARFDVALRKGAILLPDTIATAWQPPLNRLGQPLPHGLGWFVQTYRDEKILWQFGVSDNAFSSIVMTVPSRDFSVILLANSDGLVRPFPLANGDLAASPFGRVMLGAFGR
jgi:CubicO group peptidase (beta-lactamase class C family)